MHRRLKTSLAGIRENRFEASSCSRGLTQRLLGLQLCADVSYPNASEAEIGPHFPLTGPAHLSVELVKFDPSITSYRFLHRLENTESLKAWTLTFNPQGVKDSKEVGIKGRIDSDAGHLGIKLMLPINTYEVNGIFLILKIFITSNSILMKLILGTFKWYEDSKMLEASFIRDVNNKVVMVKASLDRSTRSKQQIAFLPKLILTYGNQNFLDLNGIFTR